MNGWVSSQVRPNEEESRQWIMSERHQNIISYTQLDESIHPRQSPPSFQGKLQSCLLTWGFGLSKELEQMD